MLTKIITKNSVSFMIGNTLHSFTKSALGDKYDALLGEVYSGTEESVKKKLVTLGLWKFDPQLKKEIISKYTNGTVVINSDNKCFYISDGYEIEIPFYLQQKIYQLIHEKIDFSYIVNFIKNLMENPYSEIRNDLYLFLESGNIPITPDGCFLAYKKVKNDLTSFHQGGDGKTYLHEVGAILSMPREKAERNRGIVCSTGLHFCSYSYLNNFYNDQKGKIVLLKINPKDVVSIPYGYNNSKGRACEYEIVSILQEEKDELAFIGPITSENHDSQINYLKKSNIEIKLSTEEKSTQIKDIVLNQYFKIVRADYLKVLPSKQAELRHFIYETRNIESLMSVIYNHYVSLFGFLPQDFAPQYFGLNFILQIGCKDYCYAEQIQKSHIGKKYKLTRNTIRDIVKNAWINFCEKQIKDQNS